MMTVVSALIFAGAFAAAVSVIVLSVSPQWRRIMRLAGGEIEQPFAPLSALALAERRIAVRGWAAMPAPVSRMRAAA